MINVIDEINPKTIEAILGNNILYLSLKSMDINLFIWSMLSNPI